MKIKDFMGAKYEKNRWYVAPTEDMFADARKQNTIPDKKPEQARPLRTLGGHIPNLIVQSNQVSRGVSHSFSCGMVEPLKNGILKCYNQGSHRP